MSMEELMTKVTGWVAEKSREIDDLDVAIEPDTNLLESGLLDSLGFIELVVFIEATTGNNVDLMGIEPESFTNIRGLCSVATKSAA